MLLLKLYIFHNMYLYYFNYKLSTYFHSKWRCESNLGIIFFLFWNFQWCSIWRIIVFVKFSKGLTLQNYYEILIFPVMWWELLFFTNGIEIQKCTLFAIIFVYLLFTQRNHSNKLLINSQKQWCTKKESIFLFENRFKNSSIVFTWKWRSNIWPRDKLL